LVAPNIANTGTAIKIAEGGGFNINFADAGGAWPEDQLAVTLTQPVFCGRVNVATPAEICG
jgi:hypothetical protein